MFNKNVKAGLTVWTLIVSLCLHGILLAAFALIKISTNEPSLKIIHTPSAKIQAVKRIIEKTQQILPKPKIHNKKLFNTADMPIAPILSTLKKPVAITSKNDNRLSALAALPKTALTPAGRTARIEFFGSAASQRNICYVVDCSGSMQGIFSLVRQNLKKSLSNLEPDQYFYIIFFGANRLYEFGSGSMLRASPTGRLQACDFINSITPSGTTNAFIALNRAFQIKDSLGNAPQLIYFLTDGFDLSEDNGTDFAFNLSQLHTRLCRQTKINTIGFWTKPQDCSILRQIAADSGGTFTLIAQPKTERYIEIE